MRFVAKVKRRIRLLVDRAGVEREMAEEMQFHLEQAAGEMERAGLDPDAARREARRAFGGVEPHKEAARDARGGRLLDDLRADGRYAIRQLRRQPGHAAAVVGILAVAIGAAGAMVSMARGYLSRPLPIPDPDRVVSIIGQPTRAPFPNPPNLRGVDWVRATDFMEESATWDLDGFTILGGLGPQVSVRGAWVSPGYFRGLGIVPALGRLFDSSEYVPGSTVAVISDEVWRRRFGADSQVVGRSIRAHSTDRPEEEAEVTIVGVLPPLGWRINDFTEVLRPLGTPRFFYLARLPAGLSITDAQDRLTAAVRAQATTDPSWHMGVTWLRDDYVRPIRPALNVLLAAAALLGLLAVASAGTLIVGRGLNRLHEVAIRRAIGAGRGRLARQFIVEIGLLASLALLAGLGLAALADGVLVAAVERFGRVAFPGGAEAVRLEWGAVGMVAAAIIAPIVGIALVTMSTLHESSTIASGGRSHLGTPRAARARQLLAALQVAAAVALVSQGVLLTRNIQQMLAVDLGFEPTRLMLGQLLLPRAIYPDTLSRARAIDRIVDRVQAVPGVSGAAFIDHPPFRGLGFEPVQCESCQTELTERPLAHGQTVTARYFDTMGLPILRGRSFDGRDDLRSPPVAIISERLAQQLWPGDDPLGRRLRIGNTSDGSPEPPWLTVVGVTREIRKTYSDSLYPDVYRFNGQAGRLFLTLVTRTVGDPVRSAEAIRIALAAEHETLALAEFRPMTEVLADQRSRPLMVASFVTAVAAVAFGLAGFGVYAVVAYLALARRREFAIRTAVGARPFDIGRVVLADAATTALWGVTVGVALSAAAAKVTQSLLVATSPADPIAYLIMIAGVAALVGISAAVPARQASRTDPAIILRDG